MGATQNATITRSLKALLSIVTQHFLLSNLCDFFSWIFLTQHFLLSDLSGATFWSNKKHSGPIKALGVALGFLLDQNVWKVQINNLFKDRISWWMGWDILWVLAIAVATAQLNFSTLKPVCQWVGLVGWMVWLCNIIKLPLPTHPVGNDEEILVNLWSYFGESGETGESGESGDSGDSGCAISSHCHSSSSQPAGSCNDEKIRTLCFLHRAHCNALHWIQLHWTKHANQSYHWLFTIPNWSAQWRRMGSGRNPVVETQLPSLIHSFKPRLGPDIEIHPSWMILSDSSRFGEGRCQQLSLFCVEQLPGSQLRFDRQQKVQTGWMEIVKHCEAEPMLLGHN